MVPYWVGQSPSQGVFPKKTLSKSCSEYEVDGGMNFGHGVLDISRAHIVSSMGTFVDCMLQTLFEALLIVINFLWSVLSHNL
jgi:hypothetical protein